MFISDLEKDIVDSSISLNNILMKAKILASRLKNQDLKIWIEREINGYNDKEDIPSYRIVTADLYGSFSGSFGSSLENGSIPFKLFSVEDQLIFNNKYVMFSSVSALENLIRTNDNLDKLTVPYNGDHLVYLNIIMQEKNIYSGMNCLHAYKLISKSQIVEVVSTIRNKLLSIVLELIEKYPENVKSNEGLAKIPISESNLVINNNIYGSTIGNLISGYNMDVSIVKENDIESLLDLMRQINIEEPEINNLKIAVEKDKENGFVNKVGQHSKKWLLKLSEKAFDGLLGIGGAKLIPVVDEALKKFFGI